MVGRRRCAILISMMMVVPIVLVACGATAEPQIVVETVIVEQTRIVEQEGEIVTIVETVQVEVTETPELEQVLQETEIGSYRIALFQDPVSSNYWNYLGPGSSVWTSYVLSGQQPSLFTLADKTFAFVPFLAKDLPEPVDNGDGTWTIIVEMVEDAMWSDGEPITAHDVVYTHNACKDLKLTQNWPNVCAPNDVEIDANAVGDYTVEYIFHTAPSLGTWQNGVAQAPIMPQHFWQDAVDEAYAFVEGLTEPDVERPPDCEAEDLSAADQAACEAWVPYDEAYVNARRTLYEADASGQPSGGGYIFDRLELGAFAQRTANGEYYFKGAEIVEYEDGTWMRIHPNGTIWQLYGQGTGQETLRYTSGPYAPNIIFSIYGSQGAAFLALADGEVDFVLNPLGLSRGLQEQAEKGQGIKVYVNPDYGMYHLSFNMRKYPMSEYAFRQAVDILTDKEFVVYSVLGGAVFPMYSTMPPGNEFWFNPAAEANPYIGWSREQRVNEAVRVLKEAGWSWSKDPAWDENLQDVVPGVGITMPDGKSMPELTILGPGPAYDPLRATFNQWISEWMRELGMPVQSELTGFNAILGPVFVDANYDMYILGWGLGNPGFPAYFESFWHSRNDTATTGNYNTPGFNNAEYDALIDEFMSTTDMERARDLIFEAQLLLADQRPYICLFYKQTIDLARDNIIYPYTQVLGGLELQNGFQTDAIPLVK
jgi:peptide/nickel transport system substrate-binding protein